MVHGPTDWVSGERVFAPPSGTLDVDWLVPAVLDAVPGTTPDRARLALAAAWSAARAGSPAPAGDAVERRARDVVQEARTSFGV